MTIYTTRQFVVILAKMTATYKILSFVTSVIILKACYVTSQTCACCDDGWIKYKGSCYLFSTLDKVNRTQARDYCDQHESHLVRIETSIENAYLEDHIRHLNGRHFWLDLTDKVSEGVWVWKSTKEPTDFTDWDDGEPLPPGPGDVEDCAAISVNAWDHGRWIDLPCTWNFASPLCEKSLPVDTEVPELIQVPAVVGK